MAQAAPIEQFGKYQILERIARGGMAEIFKARMEGIGGFNRLFAIKRIVGGLSQNREYIDLLVDEAKVAGLLSHANIVQIVDLGEVNGQYYVAMEYVEGRDLGNVIRRCAERGITMPLPHAVFTLIEVLKGLEYAHNRTIMRGNKAVPCNIIHRDVSPSNVLVSFQGEVKLTDFGIAKANVKAMETLSGVIKGKWDYYSPEQAAGEPVDQRHDIFEAGVLLYEMLTGTHPFRQPSELKTIEAIKNGEYQAPSFVNPDIPYSLEVIIDQALARNPGERFRSATDFKDALNRFFHDSGFIFSQSTLAAFLKGLFPESQNRKKPGAPATMREQETRPLPPEEDINEEDPPTNLDNVPSPNPAPRVAPVAHSRPEPPPARSAQARPAPELWTEPPSRSRTMPPPPPAIRPAPRPAPAAQPAARPSTPSSHGLAAPSATGAHAIPASSPSSSGIAVARPAASSPSSHGLAAARPAASSPSSHGLAARPAPVAAAPASQSMVRPAASSPSSQGLATPRPAPPVFAPEPRPAPPAFAPEQRPRPNTGSFLPRSTRDPEPGRPVERPLESARSIDAPRPAPRSTHELPPVSPRQAPAQSGVWAREGKPPMPTEADTMLRRVPVEKQRREVGEESTLINKPGSAISEEIRRQRESSMSAAFPALSAQTGVHRLVPVPRDANLDEEEARKRAAEWGDEVETAIRQDPIHGRGDDEELSLDESTHSVKGLINNLAGPEVSTALRTRPAAVTAAIQGWPTARVMVFAFIVGCMGLVIGLGLGIGGTALWFTLNAPDPVAVEP